VVARGSFRRRRHGNMLNRNLGNCLVSRYELAAGRRSDTRLIHSYLFEEDRPTSDESSFDRRIVHLDRTAFPTSKAQGHGPKRSLGQHGPAAGLRAYVGRPHWSMSRLYAIGGEEHLEGRRAGQAEGDAQANLFVAGAVDLKA